MSRSGALEVNGLELPNRHSKSGHHEASVAEDSMDQESVHCLCSLRRRDQGKSNNSKEVLKVHGITVPRAESDTLQGLGSIVTANGGDKEDIAHRVKQAGRSYFCRAPLLEFRG